MKYIENELLHVKSEMRKNVGKPKTYKKLYAVMQALEWVLDPLSHKGPVATVLEGKCQATDIQEGSVGCSDDLHPQPSSNICSQSDLVPR